MIYESSLIESFVKNHIDKSTIKLIFANLKDEIEWDSDLIEIFAENGILDIAFELLDKNTIIDLLSSGEVDIKKYRKSGWIPTNMSFPKGTFENINNGGTIYNILTNLFDINLDGNDYSPGGFYDNLCIAYLSDEELECIGGRDILISMLETYGHLNGWYRATWDSENYGEYARFYRDEKEVVGYFDCCGDRTIQDICRFTPDINPIEVQKYLQNKFNEKYELTGCLGHDEIFSLALEFELFYKL